MSYFRTVLGNNRQQKLNNKPISKLFKTRCPFRQNPFKWPLSNFPQLEDCQHTVFMMLIKQKGYKLISFAIAVQLKRVNELVSSSQLRASNINGIKFRI